MGSTKRIPVAIRNYCAIPLQCGAEDGERETFSKSGPHKEIPPEVLPANEKPGKQITFSRSANPRSPLHSTWVPPPLQKRISGGPTSPVHKSPPDRVTKTQFALDPYFPLGRMSQSEKLANAVGAKTARACDSCIRRRARWYCAADDAFLCQACDSSVHSANPLAQRHDRVRLKTASSSSSSMSLSDTTPDLINSALPTWHQGFTRKARTPRHAKSSLAQSRPALLVPDLEDQPEAEEEEELLYRVPIFNPILSEFCSPLIDDAKPVTEDLTKPLAVSSDCLGYGFSGSINPSDIELAEFAADVESLFGPGLDDGSFCIDALGLMDVREEDASQVKVEMDDVSNMVGEIRDGMDRMEFSSESLDINFDCGSPEVEEEKVEVAPGGIGLRLDYEAVIADWSSRGCSPWTDGKRPQLSADDCLPDFMGIWGGDAQGCHGGGGHAAVVDGEREARVMRYREKRRTRLFSKKIRYEVRKLNAEKRPRMKGRFVKRAAGSFSTAAVVPAGFAY